MAKYGTEDDEQEEADDGGNSYYEEEKYNEDDDHINIPEDDELEFDNEEEEETPREGGPIGKLADTSNSSAKSSGSNDVIEDSLESTSYDQSNEETKL